MARIVFDLDGTLIDSAPDLHALANRILDAEGLAPITMAETRDFIGQGVSVFVRKMCDAREVPEAERPRILDGYKNGYADAVTLTLPYPGVAEVLARLRAAGHRLGICTNKPLAPCRAVLEHLGLEGHFEVILGGDSLPVHKPDPAPLLKVLEQLGTGPALYVGDSEIDAETARRAGLPFVFFTEGYCSSGAAELPKVAEFSRFDELPGIVDRLVAAAA